MAVLPMKTPTPMSSPASGASADGSPLMDAASTDTKEEAPQSEVLLTVMKNSDGSYTLISGDELNPAEPGPETPADGATADAGMEKGRTFEEVGALLKGILEVVKQSDGSDEQFDLGFDESKKAAPPAMAKK